VALHLLKVCVGIASIEALAAVQAKRRGRAKGSPHYTRNLPKRAAEVLAGGSMFWIIKGFVRVRQRIIGIDTVHLEEEGRFCRLLLHPELVATEPQPRKPHQGWRYLSAEEAPLDLKAGSDAADALPPELVAELKMLGLL
jgi:hypothetical protein